MAGPRKKVSAKSILADLKAGLTDAQLMQKYHISFQALQELFEKMVKANLATKSYFEKRAVSQSQTAADAKQASGATTCPYCGYSSDSSFKKCPNCGEDATEWLDTAELTDILTGSFE